MPPRRFNHGGVRPTVVKQNLTEIMLLIALLATQRLNLGLSGGNSEEDKRQTFLNLLVNPKSYT